MRVSFFAWICLLGVGVSARPSPAEALCQGGGLLRWIETDRIGEQSHVAPETPERAAQRHANVAERRKGINIICHRGASEFAHENTLEAYRASFELGADGNEIDIRATKDGVLVAFHDDMLDRVVEAYGDVSDYNWEELRRFRFREPDPFGDQCRIPTLVEVFDLHRKYSGLMHLDIKRPGLDAAVAELLTRMDMWDHVAYCNEENGGVILSDPRLSLRRYKAPGLYVDRSEVFPDAIAVALRQPGDGLIVDDPRGVAVGLGRKLGKPSKDPVSPKQVVPHKDDEELLSEAELIAILRNADDWDRVGETEVDKAAYRERIVARAKAAEQLLAAKASSKEAFAALEERVRKRSLHTDWNYHGLDGAMALRSLILIACAERRGYRSLCIVSRRPGAGGSRRSTLEQPSRLDRFPRQNGHLPGAAEMSKFSSGKAVPGLPRTLGRTGPSAQPPALCGSSEDVADTQSTNGDCPGAYEASASRRAAARRSSCASSTPRSRGRAALERGAPHALSYVVGE